MKSVKTLLFGACLSAFALCAAEPILSFPLNEGSLDAVKEATGKVKKITVWNKDQFSWTDGADGKALSFNTPDAKKSYAGLCFDMPADFDPAKGFTFTSLVKLPKDMHRSRQYQLFFWCNNHTTGPGMRIYVSWKSLYVMLADGSKKAFILTSKNSQGALQADTWYRLAAAYDGEQLKIYINGKLRGTAQGCKFKKSTRKWAAIGASAQSGSAYGFNGIISDVKIFDKALTDTEIAEMKPEK